MGRKAPSLEKKKAVSEDQEVYEQTSQQTSPDTFEVKRMLKRTSGLHKLVSVLN